MTPPLFVRRPRAAFLDYRNAKLAIDEALEADLPFSDVEALVESCGRLTEDQRSVLWLYAWHGRSVAHG